MLELGDHSTIPRQESYSTYTISLINPIFKHQIPLSVKLRPFWHRGEAIMMSLLGDLYSKFFPRRSSLCSCSILLHSLRRSGLFGFSPSISSLLFLTDTLYKISIPSNDSSSLSTSFKFFSRSWIPLVCAAGTFTFPRTPPGARATLASASSYVQIPAQPFHLYLMNGTNSMLYLACQVN